MKFDELIQYKALSLKAFISGQTTGDFVDNLLEQEGFESPIMRNICASISTHLFDEVESITGLLSLSKRQFVEGAIIEAVQKAKSIIEQVNPTENQDEIAERAMRASKGEQ